MGLDVSFDRKAALKAGILLERVWVDYTDSDGPEFEEELVVIPLTDMRVSNDAGRVPIPSGMPGWNKDGEEIVDGYEGRAYSIIVRANKWGRIYEPLTDWLRAHDIEWCEF